jgi:cellulose synthase/poly-beta-1,6-N-acetylglucosamine synthase-like glycosyltransferase
MNIPNEILISLLLFINIYTAINFVVIYGFLNLKSNTNKKLNTTKYQTFSIVIAARNEAQNISHLIDNLLSQNYPKNLFEIIVVDDFSEDNTLLILEKYLQEKNIKILKNKKAGKKAAL